MEGVSELRGSMATTPGEKCEVLKQRDKLVRAALGLHMKKQTELSEAKVLRGTCEDMCPEMERYIREDRRRLSVYEMLQGGDTKNPLVDHRLAVKEYSRSSADQDLPLPHELRPAPVLDRTMHYLLNNIADTGGDGRWGDWFDFLWNRMRGIRKEITQLQLCDLIAVGLVEKCARFHIYCGERLCEEDMMVFDEKINDENMTKCLQTLKEMYHDLHTRGVHCPNEAEFRAYMVLMNLNSGDILREVQQLREEVRAQPVIGFVVQVYSALYNNNYLRFFKLVRRATFLNACVMHRYFYQVRIKAFHILTRAYNKKEFCSADELVRVLGFESVAEALGFCSHHGLQTDENTVLMDRGHLVEPETAYVKQRAQGLIESKQAVSVGETINGAPLPENVIPEPTQNSFDAAGRYVGKDLDELPSLAHARAARAVGDQASVLARTAPEGRITPEPFRSRSSPDPFKQAQQREGTPDPARGRVSPTPPTGRVSPLQRGLLQRRASPVPTAADRQSPEPTQQPIPNEIVKDIAKGLFLEVIREYTEGMSQQLVRAVRLYLDYDTPISLQLMEQTLPQQIRSVAEKALEECRQETEEQEARARAELSMRKRKIEAEMADRICEQQVDRMIRQVAEQQCKESAEKQKQQSVQRCAERESEHLLAAVLHEQVRQVAGHVFDCDVTARLEELAQHARAVRLMVQARCFIKWKNKYAARVRLHKAMVTFPASPCPLSSQQQFSALVPRSRGLTSRGVHLGGTKRARLTLDSPLQLSQKRLRLEQHMTLRDYWRDIRRDLANAPLDMAQIVQQQLRASANSRNKKTPLLFTESRVFFKMLVSLPGHASCSDFRDWLTAKLSKGAVPDPPGVDIKARYLSLYHTSEGGQCVGVCVGAVEGSPSPDHLERLGAETQFLNGVHGLLFVLPVAIAPSQDLWSRERRRLSTMLRGLRVHDPPSLAVLCPDPALSQDDLERDLDLDGLEGQGLIASFSVHVLSTSWEQPAASKVVRAAIGRQVHRSREHYVIDSLPYMEYVEHFLHKHFTTPVYEHQAKRPRANDWTARDLVELYNSVLEHLTDLAETERLCMPEVSSRCLRLQTADPNPRLPSAEDVDPAAPPVQQVYGYVQLVAATCKGNKALLYNRVSHMMERWKRQQEYDVFSEHVTPPWVSVVMACVQCKLSLLSQHCASLEQEHGGRLYLRRRSLENLRPPPLPLNFELQYPDVQADGATLFKTPKLPPRAAFNPWFLRDELLRNASQHSLATSMFCNASMDTTQQSVTSSEFVYSARNTQTSSTHDDDTLCDSSRSSTRDDTMCDRTDTAAVTYTSACDVTAQASSLERVHDGVSEKLKWTIEREKHRNEQFEKYLKAMLDGDCGLARMDVRRCVGQTSKYIGTSRNLLRPWGSDLLK